MTNWHDSVRLGIHWDVHAFPTEEGHGRGLRKEDLRYILDEVRPDFIQSDARGGHGAATFPVRVGTAAPQLAKDSLRLYSDVARELGIPLVAHYNGHGDPEAVRRHPDWAIVSSDGQRHPFQNSTVSDFARDYAIPQILQIVEDYGVAGVWVDGDSWSVWPDWSDAMVSRYRDTVGESAPVPEGPSDEGWSEWMRVNREAYLDYFDLIRESVRAVAPEVTVIGNWSHSLRMPLPNSNLPALDYLSGDFAHSFGIHQAAIEAALFDSRELPWELLVWTFTSAAEVGGSWTTKPAEALEQEVAAVLARGGGVLLYDNVGREEPELRGKLARWKANPLKEVAQFFREHSQLSVGRSRPVALALLNPAAHWEASDRAFVPASVGKSPLPKEFPTLTNELFMYSKITEAVAGAIWFGLDAHVQVDVAVVGDDIDLSNYTTVIVAEQGSAVELLKDLESYVEAGGHLIVTGSSAHGLESLTGLSVAPATDGEQWVKIYDSEGENTPVIVSGVTHYADHPTVAVIASLDDLDVDTDRAQTWPLVFRRDIGSGSVTVSEAMLFRSYGQTRDPRLKNLIRSQIFTADAGWIETDAPTWLWITVRNNADGVALHFVNTNSGRALTPKASIPSEIPIVAPFTVTIPLPGWSVVRTVGADVTRRAHDTGLVLEISNVHVHAAIQIAFSDATQSGRQDG